MPTPSPGAVQPPFSLLLQALALEYGEHSTLKSQQPVAGLEPWSVCGVAAGGVHRTVSPDLCSHGGGWGDTQSTEKPQGDARVSCSVRGSRSLVKSGSTAHPMSSSRKYSLVHWGYSRRRSLPGSKEAVCFLTNQRSRTKAG